MTISYIGIQLKIQNNKIEMLIHVSYNHNSQSNSEQSNSEYICSEVSFAFSISLYELFYFNVRKRFVVYFGWFYAVMYLSKTLHSQ